MKGTSRNKRIIFVSVSYQVTSAAKSRYGLISDTLGDLFVSLQAE